MNKGKNFIVSLILCGVYIALSFSIRLFATENTGVIGDVANAVYLSKAVVLVYCAMLVVSLIISISNRLAKRVTRSIGFGVYQLISYIIRILFFFIPMFKSNTWYVLEGRFTFGIFILILLTPLVGKYARKTD